MPARCSWLWVLQVLTEGSGRKGTAAARDGPHAEERGGEGRGSAGGVTTVAGKLLGQPKEGRCATQRGRNGSQDARLTAAGRESQCPRQGQQPALHSCCRRGGRWPGGPGRAQRCGNARGLAGLGLRDGVRRRPVRDVDWRGVPLEHSKHISGRKHISRAICVPHPLDLHVGGAEQQPGKRQGVGRQQQAGGGLSGCLQASQCWRRRSGGSRRRQGSPDRWACAAGGRPPTRRRRPCRASPASAGRGRPGRLSCCCSTPRSPHLQQAG